MSQTWISYRRGPLAVDRGPRTGPRAGDRLPTADLPPALRDTRLHAVVLGAPGTVADDLTRRTTKLLDTLAVDIRFHRETDAGPLRAAFAVPGPVVALLRPDGHIVFRGRTGADLGSLEHLLDRYLTRVVGPIGRLHPTRSVEAPR